MRRFISWLLMVVILALPLMTSCFPSGYKKNDKNPARPPGQQTSASQLPPGEKAPDSGDTTSGGDTSGGTAAPQGDGK